MPNVGHQWTWTEELAARTFGWEEFHEAYPSISFNAYRQRRGRLERSHPSMTCRLCRFFHRLHGKRHD